MRHFVRQFKNFGDAVYIAFQQCISGIFISTLMRTPCVSFQKAVPTNTESASSASSKASSSSSGIYKRKEAVQNRKGLIIDSCIGSGRVEELIDEYMRRGDGPIDTRRADEQKINNDLGSIPPFPPKGRLTASFMKRHW